MKELHSEEFGKRIGPQTREERNHARDDFLEALEGEQDELVLSEAMISHNSNLIVFASNQDLE
jgi:hypothetical protein